MKRTAMDTVATTKHAVVSSPERVSQCGCTMFVCMVIDYIQNKLYLFGLKPFNKVSNFVTGGKKERRKLHSIDKVVL